MNKRILEERRRRYEAIAARVMLAGAIVGTIAGLCGVYYSFVAAALCLDGFCLMCWITGNRGTSR